MEYQEQLLAIDNKISANADRLKTAKERVTTLETQRQQLELQRKELQINDYLPIIEALKLSPADLQSLLSDYLGGDDAEHEEAEEANEDEENSEVYG